MPHFRLHGACFLYTGNYSHRFFSKKIAKILFDAMTSHKNAGVTKSNSRNITSSVAAKTNQVYEIFNKLFQSYSPEQTFVSFNGGKDGTVVLDLISRYFKEQGLIKVVIPVLYIQPKSPFPEVEDFVAQCKQTYSVDIIKQKGAIKPVLESFCAQRTDLKAVLMGVRRTDPRGRDMKHIELCDPGWPELLRVNPILEWTTRDVWAYIRENKVPYCSLYDVGYTSIGETTNTSPNLHLKREDPATGEVTFRPAYELLDDSLEREGRW